MAPDGSYRVWISAPPAVTSRYQALILPLGSVVTHAVALAPVGVGYAPQVAVSVFTPSFNVRLRRFTLGFALQTLIGVFEQLPAVAHSGADIASAAVTEFCFPYGLFGPGVEQSVLGLLAHSNRLKAFPEYE